MSTSHLVILIAIFFLTSVLSVVTGSTSLITVPAMIALGVEPRTAVATNMLALTLMSAGGTMQFIRRGAICRAYLPVSIALTVAGSGLGAFLLLTIPVRALQFTIAIAMIAVTIFMLLKRDKGASSAGVPVESWKVAAGYLLTFLLAVYGGFFSGGYVTMLTASFVAFFGMSFIQSVATTKVINLFSSAVATAIFLWRGVVDIRLGVVLGIAMFFGALLGARIALRLSAIWLRRLFVVTTLCLAVKMLFGITS